MIKKVFSFLHKVWSSVSSFCSRNSNVFMGVFFALCSIVLIALFVYWGLLSPRIEYLSFKNPVDYEEPRLGTDHFRFGLHRGWKLEFEIEKEEEAESCLHYIDIAASSKDYFFLRTTDPEPWGDPRKIITAYPTRAPIDLTKDRDKVVYRYSNRVVPESACGKTFEIVDGKNITFEIYAETGVEGVHGLRVIKTLKEQYSVLVVYLSIVVASILARNILRNFIEM